MGYDRLLAARPDDVWLRYDVDPARVSDVHIDTGDGRAVAWSSIHPIRRVRWLTAVADTPQAAAALATRVTREVLARGDGPVSGVTVPTGGGAYLPGDVRPPTPDDWTWWWTADPPVPRPGEGAVIDLSDDDPRIGELLAHSDSAYVFPGDHKIRRWVGVTADTGASEPALVACAAHVEHIRGVPHLASVCTAPAYRGRGLAADVCTLLTRDALRAGAPVVTLGMYAGNTAAASVYRRLGFVLDKAFTSGWLPGQGPPADVDPREVEPADGGGTT